MPIEVTLRHQKSDPTVKLYAEQQAEQLIGEYPKVDSVHLVIDHQRHLFDADVVVHLKGHIARAREHATNLRGAIDIAIARVRKQLRKITGKIEKSHLRQEKHI